MAISKELHNLVVKMKTYIDDCKVCKCNVVEHLYHDSTGTTIRFEIDTPDVGLVGDILQGLRLFINPKEYKYELTIMSPSVGSISLDEWKEWIFE